MWNRITDELKSTQGNYEQNSAIVGFTVFGDPVSKLRPRTVRNMDRYGQVNVHTYTPTKTKDHEDKIAWVYRSVYGNFMFEKGVPLLVEMRFFLRIPQSANKKMKAKMLYGEIRPTKRIGDLDNFIKCATDALNGVAYEDDSQIVELIGRKYYSEEPRTEIIIARLEDEQETG